VKRTLLIRSVLILLVIVQIFCAIKVLQLNKERKELSEDLVELSKVKYGIFNVDEWKEKLTEIVAKKIDEFEITADNRAEMRVKIEDFLRKQVDRFESDYYETNSGSLGGFLKNVVASVTSTFSEIRKQIPQITDDILNFLEDPENRQNLKEWVRLKIDEYADKTFAETDYTFHDYILTKYGFPSREEGIVHLKSEIEGLQKEKQDVLYLTAVLFVLVFGLLAGGLTDDRISLLVVVIFSMVLLGLGVMLPMIEIDARIEELSFTLLGEPVLFSDQILYYKNKSILEVVGLLIEQGKLDLILVAALVFLFSVLFPLSKLLTTVFYLFHKGSQSKGWVNFLVFKTGKWSMADVMVVAIFMAYIGFSGIVSEQLSQLENVSNTIDILTTNHSKLNEGFFLFTGFVVLSLFVSVRVEKGRGLQTLSAK